MSSNITNPSYYAPLPNATNTILSQHFLLQNLNQGTQPSVTVPHPVARRAVQHRRRQQIALPQTTIHNVTIRRARNLLRGHSLRARQREVDRRIRQQAQAIQDNLDRYGVTRSRQLILEARISDLMAILRAIKPQQLRAMLDVAVALEKANENVPSHTALVFNSALGRDLMLLLDAPIH